MALDRPPARELRDEFGLDQNFSVKGAVSLEDVPATLNFVSIEPFARQPVCGGVFDRNTRNQQEKSECDRTFHCLGEAKHDQPPI
jgi:hypothetical protein